MSKAIKNLLVIGCFAIASVSVQALACDQHAEKADKNSSAQTSETKTACACGNEKCDGSASCDACENCDKCDTCKTNKNQKS